MNCVCVFTVEMDPSLLRERELFKKRALSTPAVEKRHAAESSSHKKKKSKADKEGSSGSKQGGGKHMSFLASFIFCSVLVQPISWCCSSTWTEYVLLCGFKRVSLVWQTYVFQYSLVLYTTCLRYSIVVHYAAGGCN